MSIKKKIDEILKFRCIFKNFYIKFQIGNKWRVLCLMLIVNLSLMVVDRFHPNLILGGTYSGQVMLWDNRVQKRTPIQRTPLSATAHTVSKLI